MSERVAVLFARRKSHYLALGCDVYDEVRDARSFAGGKSVIAHPPCRAWGRLRHWAKPRKDEMDLARFAMAMVRQWGGVLEHPMCSKLWEEYGLLPGVRDEFGGILVPIDQKDFGHRALKRTGLYCVGCMVQPGLFGQVQGVVQKMGKAERERTPLGLAVALVEAVRACHE